MRNKKLCNKCKFHSFMGPTPKNDLEGKDLTAVEKRNVMCYYSVLSGRGPALKNIHNYLIDRRGYDPNRCRLFEEGSPQRRDF